MGFGVSVSDRKCFLGSGLLTLQRSANDLLLAASGGAAIGEGRGCINKFCARKRPRRIDQMTATDFAISLRRHFSAYQIPFVRDLGQVETFCTQLENRRPQAESLRYERLVCNWAPLLDVLARRFRRRQSIPAAPRQIAPDRAPSTKQLPVKMANQSGNSPCSKA